MSRYENYEIKNNVFGTLSAPISSLATTIQLGDGQGQRFSENMLATLENIENGKVMKREIVLITAINGDVLTVERKYAPCPVNDDANTQGKISYAFSTDDTISAYIDKEHFDKIDDSINDIYDNGVNKLRTEVVSGLQIKVNAGPVLVGSGYYDFAGGTLTLINNATNYVEIDEDGLLVSNTTGRVDENTKVSNVITSGGEVIKIEDWRLGTVGGKIGGINIHELTEKQVATVNDEFLLADADGIYGNKKTLGASIITNDLKEPTNLVISKQGTTATIKREDPQYTAGPRTIPATVDKREKSMIVRKQGSEPVSPDDGDIIEIETVKNAYCSVGFDDCGLACGNTYYYRIFSKATNGRITYGDSAKAVIKDPIIRALVVGGGGGGGGHNYGGGGGAGGVIECNCILLSTGTYPVVVGCGGTAGCNSQGRAGNGGNSIFCGITACGGGGGGSTYSGANGASGGGGGAGGAGGTCIVGQGCKGGNSVSYSAGGGGGAGGAGGDTRGAYNGGDGGIGLSSDITGETVYYGGGGGGWGRADCHMGVGGQGGGGNGNQSGGYNATGYGGGGGGGSGTGGCGYGGVVIIAYEDGVISATGGNSCYLCNGYCVHIFTSDGNFIVN